MYKTLVFMLTFLFLTIIFNCAEGNAEMVVQLGHADAVNTVSFSPNVTYVASDSDDAILQKKQSHIIRRFLGF